MKSETDPRAHGFLAGAFFFLACLLLLQTSCAPRPHVEGAPQGSKPGVGKLYLFQEDGSKAGHCTVWNAGHGRLITAGHCCDEKLLYVVEEDGHASVAVSLYDDDAHDICIMEGYMRSPPIPVAWHDPAIGEYVWTAGYPVKWLLISDGFWSGRTDIIVDNVEHTYGVVSVVSHGGSSGSPVMDASGQAIGMLVAGMLHDGDNITFVTTVEWLRFDLRQTHH